MMKFHGFTLDPFQEKAIRAVREGRSVFVAAPTGAGKTLIAEYAVERAVEEGSRLVYTAPIKALSNQKFRDFRARFGASVGIVTGDVSINPEAPLIVMTTEIFRNAIFESPERLADVRWVVFDEIHYMDDSDRGTVWEESIIFAPPTIRFICLSATIPNVAELTAWMGKVRGEKVVAVKESERPVPLRHSLFVRNLGFVPFKKLDAVAKRCRRDARGLARRGKKWSIDYLLDHLCDEGQLPALYFAFKRKTCEKLAWENRGRMLLSEEQRREILEHFDAIGREFEVNPESPAVQRLRSLISTGVAYHHAGLLPTFKEIVERLFTLGYIRLLFTTETFSLGINMPAAAVVFDTLDKFNGINFSPLMTREYFQMAGRAGRRGMDDEGFVYGQTDPRFFDAQGIRDTIFGSMEPVVSRFNLGYSTILNLYERLGEGIFKTAEKSFAAFQRKGGKKKGHSGDFARVIRARLAVLRELGYIRGRELLPRGRFAAVSVGFEIHLTELAFSGILEDLDPEHLVVALTALVFEPRGRAVFAALDTPAREGLQSAVEGAMARVRAVEKKAGVTDRVKPPDFSLSRGAWLWCQGADLAKLAEAASTDPGDLVRSFRMTIQLLRQLRFSPSITENLAARAAEAIALVNRGEVDAERQLNVEPAGE